MRKFMNREYKRGDVHRTRGGYARYLKLAMVSTALPLTWQPAVGQTAQDNAASGDIVVTAQRREQSLQDVGIAVAAFSADTLKEMGLSKSTDIAQLTPGIYVSGSYGGQTQQFTIRGVTQSDFSDFLEAPVAVYIDDVYVPTQQGQTLALFDIQRVEVLKGPQGTLFGRNATGGLVNTLVVQPKTDAVGGSFDLTYSRFNDIKTEAAVNLPLSAKAAVRVSGYYNTVDNYWKNIYPAGAVAGAPLSYGPAGASPTPCCQDLGGGRTYAGRAQLLLEPTDDLKIRLSLSGAKQSLSSAPYTSVATIGTYDDQGRLVQVDRASPTETRLAIGPGGGNYADYSVIPFASFAFPGNGTRAPGANWFGYVPVDPKDLNLSVDYARRRLNTASVWTGSAHIDYSLGDVDIASITAYQRHNKQFFLDGDGSPVNFVAVPTRARTSAFSQEVRASGGDKGFRWTAGVYYLDSLTNSEGGLLGARGSVVAALFGQAADGIDIVPIARLHTKSISGFGQAEIGLADKWTLILGGRVIREHQNYDITMNVYANVDDYTIDTGVFLFPYAAPYSNERTKTLWAGKAQLEYRPVNKLLLYAGVNRGVKGGNYNFPGPGTPLTSAQMSYKPEVLTNYEGGFKYGDRLFSLNGTGFYYDYKDYQAFLFSNASGFVQNVNSKVYGFDLDAGFQITDALRATLGASYSHGAIKDFEVAPGIFRTVRPTYAPRKQASAALNYVVPSDVAGGRLSFNAQANYASGFYHNLRNFDGDWFKGRTLVNLSVNWNQEPEGLRLTAFLNNAFDKRYGQIGFDNVAICGCNLESYGTQRTYGMTLGYRF
ncbi:TonB-dependent receptor [Sphingobium sp.]|uniref:TonB-dependent receptor n=1 Tax=Sphingobium sp. TaxID=1912891 RepID=UPI0028BE44CF|nr:TonB-dependent receptor [Sphingobium sp.]